jgi:hypothetical protein
MKAACFSETPANFGQHSENPPLYIGVVVFTAMIMKNAVFWDVAPRASCSNRRFRVKSRLHLKGAKKTRARNNVSSLLVTANVPSLRIVSTLKMEVTRSSETRF